jgi:opacity protein-like surface antigen
LDDAFRAVTLSQGIDEQDFGYMLGLGLAVYAMPRWRVRLEYQFFEIDTSFLAATYAEEASVDSLTIGVDYGLGRRDRRANP